MEEVFAKWPEIWQIVFVFVCLVAGYSIIQELINGIVVILRGHPPVDNSPPKRASCNNDDNLTGHCINEGQDCATWEQCLRAVNSKKSLPIIKE